MRVEKGKIKRKYCFHIKIYNLLSKVLANSLVPSPPNECTNVRTQPSCLCRYVHPPACTQPNRTSSAHHNHPTNVCHDITACLVYTTQHPYSRLSFILFPIQFIGEINDCGASAAVAMCRRKTEKRKKKKT